MCLSIYLASSKPLPNVKWNEDAPGFYVDELSPRDATVKARLTLPHVYFVGSHHGCGCGFIKSMTDEIDRVMENYAALAAYVHAARAADAELEFYACWGGEETMDREHDETIDEATLMSDEFEFQERAHYAMR